MKTLDGYIQLKRSEKGLARTSHPFHGLASEFALAVKQEHHRKLRFRSLSEIVLPGQRHGGYLPDAFHRGHLDPSCAVTSKGQGGRPAVEMEYSISSIDTSSKREQSLFARAGSSRASNSVGGRFHGEKARDEISSWLTWTALDVGGPCVEAFR